MILPRTCTFDRFDAKEIIVFASEASYNDPVFIIFFGRRTIVMNFRLILGFLLSFTFTSFSMERRVARQWSQYEVADPEEKMVLIKFRWEEVRRRANIIDELKKVLEMDFLSLEHEAWANFRLGQLFAQRFLENYEKRVCPLFEDDVRSLSLKAIDQEWDLEIKPLLRELTGLKLSETYLAAYAYFQTALRLTEDERLKMEVYSELLGLAQWASYEKPYEQAKNLERLAQVFGDEVLEAKAWLYIGKYIEVAHDTPAWKEGGDAWSKYFDSGACAGNVKKAGIYLKKAATQRANLAIQKEAKIALARHRKVNGSSIW
jgi:hypothetical protein